VQLSKYTLFVHDYPNPGEHLVYHTRTQSLIKIHQELYDALDSIRRTGVTTMTQYEENLADLYRMGILVQDEADDRKRLDHFMEQKKWGINQSLFHATILTTYNCNFACTYCFEESTRTSSQKLDHVTSDLIIAWLQRKVQKLNVRAVELNYYGGEPLLNQPVMEHITSRMKKWCDSGGVKFKMALQTNGALLTPEFVDRYLPLGLVGAQVTVDGTKQVHDRQRPMRGSGKGTFDLVIQNLLVVADKIKITVAAGYDKGDPRGILDLLDYLDSIGLLKKLKGFTYAPIHPTLGPKEHPEHIVSSGCLSNYETETLLHADTAIKEVMRKKGMFTKSGLSVSMCPVTSGDSSVTIDTQGHIYKCNAMLGHPDLAVGDVRENEYNERHRSFMAMDAWKQCDADCPYVPLCNTGCRLFSMFKKGDFAAKSCERSYMDKFVPDAIKKEYQNQMAMKKKGTSPAKEVLV
jgi:uncharacterized protein